MPGQAGGRRPARRARAPVAEARALPHAERECGADREADLACRGPYGSAHQRARFQRARGRRLPAARAGVRARSALHDQEVTSHTRPGSLHEPGRPSHEWGGPLRPFHHLYVHIPFCKHKCGYCDFNAYAGMDRLMPDYVDALERELVFARERYPFQELDSVYLGGGTPSLLQAQLMARLLAFIRRTFNVAPDAEVTLEANPASTDEAKVAAWLEGGVNRLSLGVQGFDRRALAVLERKTDAAQAIKAFSLARKMGMSNISIDLIYAVPFQSLETWIETLRRAIAMQPDHVSTYCLSFEEGTLLYRRRAEGRVPEVETDLQWDQLDAACDELEKAGFRRYEVSSWAHPGFESRHNQAYWRCRPVYGAGAGAHSYAADGVNAWRWWNVARPRDYIAAAPSPRADGEELDARKAAAESLMLGLRTVQGATAPSGFDRELDRLQRDGLVRRVDGRVVPTRRGLDLHNQIALAVL
ncbi:MAG: radical SAM family heme chaperone HemW [Chloroflexi bacterium]|nr:MAG: radical SAM family heme chaperone HemW [Chloroflexota bacterium]